MKQVDNFKHILFLCDPLVYKHIQEIGRTFYRTQSEQINYLLELALELREEDKEVEMFRNWRRTLKEQEDQQKEKWLEKELAKLEQILQKMN